MRSPLLANDTATWSDSDRAPEIVTAPAASPPPELASGAASTTPSARAATAAWATQLRTDLLMIVPPLRSTSGRTACLISIDCERTTL